MRRSRDFIAALRGIVLVLVVASGCDQNSVTSAGSSRNGTQPGGFQERPDAESSAQSDRSVNRLAGRPSTERLRIVAFGDSLTAGLGVASGDSYPAQLQRRLDAAGYPYQVVNAGVSGDTTAGGLRRVGWVLKSAPSIVILELGANDGLRGLSLDETRLNLEQIIRRLREARVTVVLAGMKLPPNYGADYAGKFESLYADLARRFDAPLIPFFLEGVAARPALNQSDGIHPTAEGYGIVTDHILRTIEPLLRKT